MFDFETTSTIAFLIFLVVLIAIDRKNIEFNYIILIRRTKKGKKLIYKIGRKYKKILRKIGTVAVFVAIIASIVGFYFMLNSAYSILTKPEKYEPSVRFIIPKVPSEIACRYALCVPFWYWIFGILTVLLSHELMHAFISRAENIRIKSFGLLSLLVLPGAFVEPDEDQLKKSKSSTKLKIFAAGSFGNLVVVLIATLFILGFLTLIDMVMGADGVKFQATIPGTPAHKAKLCGTILEVNKERIKTLKDFIYVMNKTEPGDEVEIKTSCGDFILKTIENPNDPSKSFIGIENVTTKFVFTGFLSGFGEVPPTTLRAIDWVTNLFFWISFLNLGVGVINLLPIKPLDGGLMFEEFFKIIFKKRFVNQLINTLSIFTLGLLLINLIGPYLLNYMTSVFLITKFFTG